MLMRLWARAVKRVGRIFWLIVMVLFQVLPILPLNVAATLDFGMFLIAPFAGRWACNGLRALQPNSSIIGVVVERAITKSFKAG
jgi:hypothetical protein